MKRVYTTEQLNNFSLDELSLFSDKQLKVLSIDDLKSDLRMQFELKDLSKITDTFWIEEYPKKSLDQRVEYWLASVLKGMRTQGESGESEYSEFSKKWYHWATSKDSNFDIIFEKVVSRLGFKFDWFEYKKRIKS